MKGKVLKMKPGIHNFSEIGRLNKVLIHRIDHEV